MHIANVFSFADGGESVFYSFDHRLTFWHSYSLLPALSTQGMLYAKIVEGSFTRPLFQEFLEGLMDQMDRRMPPGSVIVMDNARIHKHPDVAAQIRERYVDIT